VGDRKQETPEPRCARYHTLHHPPLPRRHYLKSCEATVTVLHLLDFDIDNG
jgi:hypothetical protein